MQVNMDFECDCEFPTENDEANVDEALSSDRSSTRVERGSCGSVFKGSKDANGNGPENDFSLSLFGKSSADKDVLLNLGKIRRGQLEGDADCR